MVSGFISKPLTIFNAVMIIAVAPTTVLLRDGSQEVGVAVVGGIEDVGTVGSRTPAVVAAESALGEIYIEIDVPHVAPYIVLVHVVLVGAGIESFRSNIESTDVKQILSCYLQTEAFIVGKLCPTDIGLVARFLRTDIGIILIGNLSFIETYE